MGLTAARNTPVAGGPPDQIRRDDAAVPRTKRWPVKGGVKIYAGGLVVVASGVAKPGVTGAGLMAVGAAVQTVDNTGGADGALFVDVIQGESGWDNSIGDPIAAANIGAMVYVEDDHTLALTSGGGAKSAAGILTRFGADLIPWVSIIPSPTTAPAAGSVVYADLDASIHGAFSTRAGAGAIDITHRTTKLTSAAAGAAMTLADGVAGQRKTLLLTALTTPGVHTAAVTPAHGGPWTLDTVGDAMELEFDGTNWIAVNDARAVTHQPKPRILTGVGHNNAGACTLVGAKVGDVVNAVENITDHIDDTGGFEAVITVADQIQQTDAANLSAKTIMVFLRPLS